MAGEMVRIEGLDHVKAELAKFDAAVQDRAMRSALRAGGRVFQAAVQERAPERPELPSGTALPVGALAADIVMSVRKLDGGGLAAIVGPGKLTKRVARLVEYGHRMVRRDAGGSIRLHVRGGGRGSIVGDKPVPAHSFIRRAFEAVQGEAVAAFVEGLKTELKKRS